MEDWELDNSVIDGRLWVCTEHMRFLPCRPCLYGSDYRPEWHSCMPHDVERVRKFQQGK